MDYEKEYKEALKRAKAAIDIAADKDLVRGVATTIFPQLNESEDERMIKAIEHILYENYSDAAVIEGVEIAEIVTWLEKQKEPIDPFDTKLFQDGVKEGRRLEREDIKKEPIPIPDKFSGLQSLLLQYLQSAANRTDDTEIESDTDLWGRKILDYVWKYSEKPKEQKPAEWSEEDEKQIRQIERIVKNAGCTSKLQEKIHNWLKSLRSRPKPSDNWKPSEEQEVDLEKEIDKGIADYSFTKTIDLGGFKTTVLDYAKIARHFYELGLNARKEE